MVTMIAQTALSGLLNGGFYALVALGLALVFGNMKVVNLAHGELVLLAAYMAYVGEAWLGLNALLAIPLAALVVCFISAVIYLLVEKIDVDRELNSLLLTYGVAIVITNAMLLIWKSDVHSTHMAWLQNAIFVGPFYSVNGEWLFFLISIVLLLLLGLWLRLSWYGRALRAVSNSRDAAKLMGINPRSTELMSMIIAGLLATFAGAALFSTSSIQPDIGDSLTIKAFIVTVLAGVGSIPGILVGAVLLGLVEAFTIVWLGSSLQDLTGMVLFLLVLFVMPNGLFGRRGRAA